MDKLDLKDNIRLAPFTTLGIGGSTRYFLSVRSEDEVAEAVGFARDAGIAIFVLGGGSNVLISDDGFDGLTLHSAIKGIEESETSEGVRLTVGAGEEWDNFVGYCVEQGLAGVECLSGIPGLVGGTPIQNVGAYSQEVAETIIEVRCFDRSKNEFVTLGRGDCGFEYRKSIFNTTHRERFIVTGVTFMLERGGQPRVAYKDLHELFGGRKPTLREVRDGVLTIRRAKSMVIDEDDVNSRSAGSFFKNPIVSAESLIRLQQQNEGIPHFPVDGGSAKIPAAWLIERAGFPKGFALGNAGISANHTLALINRGGAAAGEILALKELIQSGVNTKFGIMLEPEPIMIGFNEGQKN